MKKGLLLWFFNQDFFTHNLLLDSVFFTKFAIYKAIYHQMMKRWLVLSYLRKMNNYENKTIADDTDCGCFGAGHLSWHPATRPSWFCE